MSSSWIVEPTTSLFPAANIVHVVTLRVRAPFCYYFLCFPKFFSARGGWDRCVGIGAFEVVHCLLLLLMTMMMTAEDVADVPEDEAETQHGRLQ